MANETKTKAAKKVSGKKMVTTAKVTMNFARHKSEFNPVKVGVIALAIILVTLLFTKFAILDPLQQKTDALAELSAKQDQMDILNAKLAGWDELQALYGRYSYGNQSGNLKDLYFCGGSSCIEPLRNTIKKTTDLTMHHICRLVPGGVENSATARSAIAAGAAMQ